MLTKGIVEKVITPYKVKVRLPVFDGIEGTRNATETNELSEAIVCSLPNSSNLVNIGDIVIIGFEDNDTSKPIILGHLFKETDNNTLVNLKVGALETTGATKLSKDTHIGEIKPKEIEALSGISSNIQGQIDNLNNQAERLLNNPNLLINGDFKVNQRGASGTQKGNAKFPVDKWKTSALNAFCTTNIDANNNVESVTVGITDVTAASGRVCLAYNFEDKDFKKLLGKKVTLSVNYEELNADVSNSVRIRFDSGVDNGSTILSTTTGTATLTFSVNPSATKLVIQIAGTSKALNYSLKLNWAKLELGSIATAFNPKNYAEELLACMRYYQIRSNDYTFPSNVIDCAIPMYKEYTRGTTTINGTTYKYIDAEVH